jgi:hypothetical protein
MNAGEELAKVLGSPSDPWMPSMLDPGLHKDIPSDRYHRRELGVASKSVLDLVHRSPAHYRAWLDGEEKDPTPGMLFGSLAHTAVLEPHRLGPVTGGKKGIQDRAAALAISDAVRAHPLAGPMLGRGDAEVTLRWDDDETGLPCKGRLDWYDPAFGLVFDLKTTGDASPREFARSVANFRYHVQAAMYLAGLRALGLPADHFVFVAVEKTPPYAVAVYSLDQAALDLGERAMRSDLGALVKCVTIGSFPGYPDTITTLELPPWAGE